MHGRSLSLCMNSKPCLLPVVYTRSVRGRGDEKHEPSYSDLIFEETTCIPCDCMVTFLVNFLVLQIYYYSYLINLCKPISLTIICPI